MLCELLVRLFIYLFQWTLTCCCCLKRDVLYALTNNKAKSYISMNDNWMAPLFYLLSKWIAQMQKRLKNLRRIYRNDIIKIVALKAISTNIVQLIPFHVFTSIFSSVIVFVLSSHDWNIETMTHHHLHLLYRHSAVSYTVFHFGIKPKMINIKSINISHLSIGSGAEWVSKNRREEQWWERVIAIF